MNELLGAESTTQEREQSPVATRQGLPAGWAWFAGLAGPMVTAVCMAVEPAPADPQAAVPVMDSLLFFGLLATIGLAAATAVRREVRALTWAAAASAIAFTLSVLCPISGHHTNPGAWWYTQLALSGAALATATIARSRFRSSP